MFYVSKGQASALAEIFNIISERTDISEDEDICLDHIFSTAEIEVICDNPRQLIFRAGQDGSVRYIGRPPQR